MPFTQFNIFNRNTEQFFFYSKPNKILNPKHNKNVLLQKI